MTDAVRFFRVHGEARLEINGRSLDKRRNAVQVRGKTHPKGVPLLSCPGVAVLINGMTIDCARRLVAQQQGNAASINITWTEY